ncbi:DUF5133 domain-containing protein [Streptomyces zhihengii]|uniref:DUF5133 domain-containing protein n=1 Tax=Streptomyces zhihengii TaxID=1818004 RepID=A0ABS2V1H7_9ACTN|nr:DUF5133 domain-containing protein [Streptomyces zhihengii]MBM9623193.1 DUF5133 domain-containing protein [Streptomyces zhihengii]
MLMPDTSVVTRLIARYRAQEHRLLDAPHDERARRRFEDTAYTLCVLMCERSAREAVLAAERYVHRHVRAAPQPVAARRAASGGC